MSEEELQDYNLEYLEALNDEELYGGDYTSAVDLKYANKEIERLNNIINELGKYLWEERYNHHGEYVLSGRKAEDIYTLILDKLEELKGVDKK